MKREKLLAVAIAFVFNTLTIGQFKAQEENCNDAEQFGIGQGAPNNVDITGCDVTSNFKIEVVEVDEYPGCMKNPRFDWVKVRISRTHPADLAPTPENVGKTFQKALFLGEDDPNGNIGVGEEWQIFGCDNNVTLHKIKKNNFFPEDDPTTTFINEALVPIMIFGVEVNVILHGYTIYNKKIRPLPSTPQENIMFPSLITRVDFITSVEANGDVTKTIEYWVTGGEENDPILGKVHRGICGYRIDMRRTAVVKCMEVVFNGAIEIEEVEEVTNQKEVKLDCNWKIGCDINFAQVDPPQCIQPLYAYGHINFLPFPDPTNYYEHEMRFIGNGMTQVHNLGTTLYDPYYPVQTTSLSNFYLWDGFYYVDVRSRTYGQSWLEWGPVCSLYVTSSYMKESMRMNPAKTNTNLYVYPNPSNQDGFNLVIDGLEEKTNNITITLYDALGKHAYTQNFSNDGTVFESTINSDGRLKKGIYLLKASVSSNTFTRKILIE